MSRAARGLAGLLVVGAAAACSGGGGGGSGGSRGGSGTPGQPAVRTCAGECSQEALSADQVHTIVTQAVNEAAAAGVAATVAVVDRVGNALVVFAMTGAPATTLITSRKGPGATPLGVALDGAPVPSAAAALSKAGTAAYLSSQGNAFSTRTASQIVQEHFNPGEDFQPGGPLFGVQFSQLPCGDLVRREGGVDMLEGPKRMPLGFSADPGGLPLYVNGVPVGGIGIESDGEYGADPDPSDFDTAVEERIAAAASAGFDAPVDRRADRIAVLGKFLRFADDETAASAPLAALATALPAGGATVAVPGFYTPAATASAGVLFLTDASGVAPTLFDGEPAELLVRTDGTTFPAANPRDSTLPLPGAGGLTSDEVRVIAREALRVAARARAQIRRPAGSAARVNIAIVDLAGAVLSLVRSPDAPVFGIDVSLQKARTAAFFSRADAGAELAAAALPALSLARDAPGTYLADLRGFLGDPTALANGIAFSDRAGGNLSRPFFPDGIDGNPNGPFSRPIGEWSPFNTGLQLDLVVDNVVAPGALTSCARPGLEELANGLQIFPGSVPIFKSGVLVGGIGISGDGVDQDDLVGFLGLHNAGALLGTVGNAPRAIRADTISVDGVRLRFVSCPPSPFLGSDDQNVCEGL